MAMPLTDRNLAICALCTDCIEGRGCRYVRKSVGVKFSIPRYARHIEKIVRVKKPRYVKKPENEKFITLEGKIRGKTKRAINLGRIQSTDICQKCGKKGKVDTHHPDYRTEKLEFLCRSCHNKEARRGKYHPPLNKVAKQRRLKLLEKKYGVRIKDIFLNFYDHPELSKADLGELIGVTRERIRQLLIQIHGTTKKATLSLKCKVKSTSNHTSKILSQFFLKGLNPQRIRNNYFKLNNDVSIEIHQFNIPTKTYKRRYYRIHHRLDTKPHFYIGELKGDIYILPVPNHRPYTTHYFDESGLPQYKEAWHLLETPK